MFEHRPIVTMGQCITCGAMASGEPEPKRPQPGPVQVQLPEEVIYCSILPRLPFRTLARLAAVCRAWRDLILRDATFAAMQAQSPSRASAALARFHDGAFQVLSTTPDSGAADVAPRDARLSFLPVAAGHRLELCACTNGLLCLGLEPGTWPRTFFVCNPATREFHVVRSFGPRGVVGLAYDPAAAAARYDLVAAVMEGTIGNFCYFERFSSAATGSGWLGSRWKQPLAPYEELSSTKPAAYAAGRLHWLTNRGNVVWHDVAGDTCGAVAPPWQTEMKGNWDIGACRGRVRLACASASHAGLGVWALASYGGGGGGASAPEPARWELVHWRSWCRVPDVVRAIPDLGLFMLSVAPAGMDPGGDEAVGLALRAAREVVVQGRTVQVWRRELLRYDPCTGATAPAVELAGKEVHDDFGMVFGYHSSMAPLPELNLATA